MPTILRLGSYRFFFYAGDYDEPYHVHIERDNCIAKFWLNPVRLYSSIGFSRNEINKIRKIVENNSKHFIRSWDEYFSD